MEQETTLYRLSGRKPPNCASKTRSGKRERARPCHDAGLTLIELLVVLAILALFAGLAAPQVIRYLGTAKTETARTQINSLVSAIELYYLDMGSYPEQDIGLKALVEAPTQAARWHGPYIKKHTALTDPWGRVYVYRIPGEHGDFDLYSLGRDGQDGGTGEDGDLSSWQ